MYDIRHMLRLGVNVDHVATVRQARYRVVERGTHPEPSPLVFALACQKAGAHGITAHLREDRRHMQDADLRELSGKIKIPLNLEMADLPAMRQFALRLRPENICLVPEKRMEVTTEGGLDVVGALKSLKKTTTILRAAGMTVSLFIDPDKRQIAAAAETGAKFVELHTGSFATAATRRELKTELKRLVGGAELAHRLGIGVNAGHGINYQNIKLLFVVPHLHELNIGHTIVSRALAVGAETAAGEMLNLMKGYRG